MINGSTFHTPSYAGNSYGTGNENEDLKAERKAEARQSLIDSIEAYKISEQKKNIDAIR